MSNGSIGNIFPQYVRWAPTDGLPPGIRMWNEEDTKEGHVSFIPWPQLLLELEHKLLPQLFTDPAGYSFEPRDYHGKPDWLVQLVKEPGEWYCHVWFGHNPDVGWSFDGLIRLGDPDQEPHVWQAYQRFSDGSYRRMISRCATLDEMKR